VIAKTLRNCVKALTPSLSQRERGIKGLLSQREREIKGNFALIAAIVTLYAGLSIAAEEQKDFITGTLPYPIDYVFERINSQFSPEDRSFFDDYNGRIYQLPHNAKIKQELSSKELQDFIASPIVRQNKFYVFFAAYKNMQARLQEITPEKVIGNQNAALERYAASDKQKRDHDIYIWSPDIPFWYSNDKSFEKPTLFRSFFIVRLNPIDEDNTEIEIIQDNPVINNGKKFSVDKNGKISNFDIKPIPPTTSEREFLLSCISQFIEKRHPNRRLFNCK